MATVSINSVKATELHPRPRDPSELLRAGLRGEALPEEGLIWDGTRLIVTGVDDAGSRVYLGEVSGDLFYNNPQAARQCISAIRWGR